MTKSRPEQEQHIWTETHEVWVVRLRAEQPGFARCDSCRNDPATSTVREEVANAVPDRTWRERLLKILNLIGLFTPPGTAL